MSSPESRSFNWHYTELDDGDLKIPGRAVFIIKIPDLVRRGYVGAETWRLKVEAM
ncbi:hypothetical protein SESBI_19705 [Sesbania bispinosa]|nr:hypothetical protein SESBI_19705 [Sesbania bispinosa]